MKARRRYRCITPAATVLGVLLSALATCEAEQGTASKNGRQPPAVSLGAKATQMLKALDTIEADVKAVSIIEINEVGETNLYQYVHFRNPSSKPLEVLPGIGSFADIPYLSVGGQQAKVEWGEYLPNKIERKFTARLQQPVPPGEWIEMIMVGQRVAKYKARQLENGRWRLGPVTADVTGSSVSAVFAIKLPPDAHLFDFQRGKWKWGRVSFYCAERSRALPTTRATRISPSACPAAARGRRAGAGGSRGTTTQ